MGERLTMIVIPPLVGLVTYAVVRLLWKRGEKKADDRAETTAAQIKNMPPK